MTTRRNEWPALPLAEWRETRDTLHLWSQIVGKIALSRAPWLNHSWHVALHVTARGLTTLPLPFEDGAFQIAFDFVDHVVSAATSRGRDWRMPLRPQSVARFYAALVSGLADIGVCVRINERPSEIADPVRFSADHAHKAYDPDYAARFFQAVLKTYQLLEYFRTGFLGKSSPAHFFWGSFDLAATRFSGRSAPPHPGGVPSLSDAVTREAYSHEVSSAGFWPGGAGFEAPAFYSYAYPIGEAFARAKARPGAAFFSETLREFLLPYDAVRNADDPEATLLAFLQSTYEAAAEAGRWDRAALECPLGQIGTPRPV